MRSGRLVSVSAPTRIAQNVPHLAQAGRGVENGTPAADGLGQRRGGIADESVGQAALAVLPREEVGLGGEAWGWRSVTGHDALSGTTTVR